MSINQIFIDIFQTGLPVVRSMTWIVDEIGQQAFDEALKNEQIVFIHNIDTLVSGTWQQVQGFILNQKI